MRSKKDLQKIDFEKHLKCPEGNCAVVMDGMKKVTDGYERSSSNNTSKYKNNNNSSRNDIRKVNKIKNKS